MKQWFVKKYIIYQFAGLLFLLWFLAGAQAMAQSMPETEIYLCRVKQKKGAWQIDQPKNLTQRPGYDNQPAFTPDGKQILFSSIREKNTTDIYRVAIRKGVLSQLTDTPEGEYSPTITPDKKAFSVVRGEEQQLWQLSLKPDQSPKLLFSHPRKVGYFGWLTPDSLAVFMLGEPHTLHLATTGGNLSEAYAANIGRSLHKVPGKSAVSFISKENEAGWEIRQLDLPTKDITTIIKALPGSEDFIWTTDGTILMAQGPKIYHYKPGQQKDWEEIADFSGTGIKNITRLALDAKNRQLAFVGVN